MRHNIIPFVILLTLAVILPACSATAVAPRSDQPAGTFAEPAREPETDHSAPIPAGENPVDLNVFAAASLTEPFREISAAFEAAYPGVRVVLNLASSQQLAHQLAQGAPADVFASANERQMDVAIDTGLIDPRAEATFATNRLAVVVPFDNPAGILTLQDLAREGLLLVLAAEGVPVGQYSQEFLDNAAQDVDFGSAYKYSVLNNVVSYEGNVKAVLNKVAQGEADVGIVYTSDLSAENRARVTRIDIPEALNVTAIYPIAAVRDNPNPELARAFIEYVLSADGQSVLSRHGFTPVGAR